MENRQTILIATIAVIIGLVLGAIGGYAYHRQSTAVSTDTPTVAQAVHTTKAAAALVTNTPADNFRTSLHTAMVTMTQSAADTGFSVVAGQTDAQAHQSDLSGAIQTMTAFLAGPYGNSVRGQAISYWQAQAKALTDYAVATHGKNPADMDKALAAVKTANSTIVTFLKSINTELPPQTTTASLAQTTNNLIAADDAYAKGDFAAAFTKRSLAASQAGILADTIVSATTKTLGNKF